MNPFRAPEPLPILNPSNAVPKNGFPVAKGLSRIGTWLYLDCSINTKKRRASWLARLGLEFILIAVYVPKSDERERPNQASTRKSLRQSGCISSCLTLASQLLSCVAIRTHHILPHQQLGLLASRGPYRCCNRHFFSCFFLRLNFLMR